MKVGERRAAAILGVLEVVSAGFRSAVFYSYWEFKGEEMNLRSRRRDLAKPHKLGGSEWNSRKCHEG